MLTAEDARYYLDVCRRYQPPLPEDPETIKAETGLSEANACNWAVYGFTVQGEITQENNLNTMAGYIEKLRAYAQTLRETIHNLYEASQRANSFEDAQN